MEGYDNLIALEDQDVAVDFASELTRQLVPFVVTHHEGMMQWRFLFQNDYYGRAGEVFAEVARAVYV